MPSPDFHRSALHKALGDPALIDLSGRFHTHVTVAAEPEIVAPLCASIGARLTVIDLAGAREQRDPMVTVDHVGGLAELERALVGVLERLADAGIGVLRVKVEHGSLPTVAAFSSTHYREAHLKLRLPRATLAAQMETLRAGAAAHGYALSRNPREQQGEHVVQFVNLRVYAGDLAETDARVDAVVAWLTAEGMAPVDVRRETAIVDTAQALDAWWA